MRHDDKKEKKDILKKTGSVKSQDWHSQIPSEDVQQTTMNGKGNNLTAVIYRVKTQQIWQKSANGSAKLFAYSSYFWCQQEYQRD